MTKQTTKKRPSTTSVVSGTTFKQVTPPPVGDITSKLKAAQALNPTPCYYGCSCPALFGAKV